MRGPDPECGWFKSLFAGSQAPFTWMSLLNIALSMFLGFTIGRRIGLVQMWPVAVVLSLGALRFALAYRWKHQLQVQMRVLFGLMGVLLCLGMAYVFSGAWVRGVMSLCSCAGVIAILVVPLDWYKEADQAV